jgi:hypothetical protein
MVLGINNLEKCSLQTVNNEPWSVWQLSTMIAACLSLLYNLQSSTTLSQKLRSYRSSSFMSKYFYPWTFFLIFDIQQHEKYVTGSVLLNFCVLLATVASFYPVTGLHTTRVLNIFNAKWLHWRSTSCHHEIVKCYYPVSLHLYPVTGQNRYILMCVKKSVFPVTSFYATFSFVEHVLYTIFVYKYPVYIQVHACVLISAKCMLVPFYPSLHVC